MFKTLILLKTSPKLKNKQIILKNQKTKIIKPPNKFCLVNITTFSRRSKKNKLKNNKTKQDKKHPKNMYQNHHLAIKYLKLINNKTVLKFYLGNNRKV